ADVEREVTADRRFHQQVRRGRGIPVRDRGTLGQRARRVQQRTTLAVGAGLAVRVGGERGGDGARLAARAVGLGRSDGRSQRNAVFERDADRRNDDGRIFAARRET